MQPVLHFIPHFPLAPISSDVYLCNSVGKDLAVSSDTSLGMPGPVIAMLVSGLTLEQQRP